MTIYLSRDVLAWKALSDSGTLTHQADWDKAYQYLGLAQNIIESHKSEFGLIDLVANLKRSIDHRIKKLAKDYSFRTIKRRDIPSDPLGKLEYFGLIRPTMINVIIGIRNQIEHGFSEPPPKADAKNY